MPKFRCRCGTRMNFSSGWTDNERSLVKEETLTYLASLLDGKEFISPYDFHDILNKEYHRVIYCLDCLRIYVEWKGKDYYLSHIRECEKEITEGGYRCSCGCSMEHLDNNHKFLLLHEGRMDDVSDILDDNLPLSSSQLYEMIADITFSVLKCPECNRLHMKTGNSTYAVYVYEFAGQEDLER